MTLNNWKKINPLFMALISLGTVLVGVTTVYTFSQFSNTSTASNTPVETPPPLTKITALGRIEPKTAIIKVSAPLILKSDRVAQLLVEERETVKKGGAIAILAFFREKPHV